MVIVIIIISLKKDGTFQKNGETSTTCNAGKGNKDSSDDTKIGSDLESRDILMNYNLYKLKMNLPFIITEH